MAKYVFLPGRTIMLIVSITVMQKEREKKQQLSRVSLQNVLFMLLRVSLIGPWSGISEIVYAGIFLAIKVDSQVSASSNFTQKVLGILFLLFLHKEVKWKSQFSSGLEITYLVLENLPSLFFFTCQALLILIRISFLVFFHSGMN